MEVEVNRGSDGWLRAESGALSTGEAIGTGMSILVMVVQSWEDESRRLRGKDISPCRLLFLDEAARLDARSIATLFELCERLQMQLIIAAPENISPEKGTTYKLVRKVFQNTEHVHVVGLRGFAPQLLKRFREVTKRLSGELKLRRQQCRLSFRKLRFCTKKVAHYGALFFKLLYIRLCKTYRRLYTEDKPDE